MIKSGAMMFSFRKPTATYLQLAHECGNAPRPRAFISSGCGIDDSSLVYGQSAVPVVMADQHIASTVVEATVSASLRAAPKATEAANSGATHNHFTTGTLTMSPASFTPQPGQAKTLRDDPIDIPSKPLATPTVSRADTTSQTSQETTLRPLPLINQRPDRICVDRLASEKYQMTLALSWVLSPRLFL
ncbi:unnamed protein product [Sphagnum jensenii]|uniref:Uncharacterized protein n=1 Tax=Sphagnum jensenii TaxID=128206 RepID=A0ABP0WR76_9BRYO